MRIILLILLISLSLQISSDKPIQLPEQRYTVDLGYPIGEGDKAPVEAPRKVDDSTSWDEHTCLSRAIYFESKGESDRGKILVAMVTINRVNSDKKYFPNTICQVVKQKVGKRCTYSWFCDGRSDIPKDLTQYRKSETIATNAMNGKYRGITKALYFKRCSVISRFFDKLKYLGREGGHCFFNEYEE